MIQALDEWQDYVDDERLRTLLASAAAELRRRKMYQEFVATLAVCLLAIIVFLNFEILRSTQENNRASFTTVEKAKLKQLDAAIDTCKVPR
jgi:hypothetical protein